MAKPSAQVLVEKDVGYIMADTSRLIRKQMDRRVKHTGLSRTEWLVLAYVERRPGSTLAMLAEQLQQPKTGVARIVGEMERAGWLMRKDGEYYLTPNGLNMNEEVKGPALSLLEQCFHGLSPERREAFMHDLRHIRANLLWMATDGDGTTPKAPPRRRQA